MQYVELSYISKGWERFCPYFSFEVGDGFTISFWHNPWCCGGPLNDLFPGLYNLAVDRNAMVAKYREQGSGAFV